MAESLENLESNFLVTVGEKLAAVICDTYYSISADEIVSDNLLLSEVHENWSERERAKSVIRNCIWKCSRAGLTTSSLSMIPFIGTGVAYASIIPEELFIFRALFTMVLRIGNLYGLSPKRIKFSEVLPLVGLECGKKDSLSGFDLSKRNAKRTMTKTATRVADQMLAKRFVTQLFIVNEKNMTRWFVQRLPILGAILGSGMNIFQARQVGLRAIEYFEERA
ncbi:MAG: hypothetical protein HQM15_08360 [Deltaproteobacteria bacterium]|nr:hypothetical protein [Deltaproteobacteria bacterium]